MGIKQMFFLPDDVSNQLNNLIINLLNLFFKCSI